MATRQVITQMASKDGVRLLRFRLQMAEQANRLGRRLSDLREARGWKQKDVVAAMAEAGDLSLNTNQLSRYENGGAYPGEARLQRFAEIFEVDISSLLAPDSIDRGDLMESLNDAQGDAQLPKQVADALDALKAELGEKLDRMNGEIEELRQLAESSGRSRKSTGS